MSINTKKIKKFTLKESTCQNCGYDETNPPEKEFEGKKFIYNLPNVICPVCKNTFLINGVFF